MDPSFPSDDFDSTPLYKLTIYRQQAVDAYEEGEKELALKLYKKSLEEADSFLDETPEDSSDNLRSEVVEFRSIIQRQVHRLESPSRS